MRRIGKGVEVVPSRKFTSTPPAGIIASPSGEYQK